MCMLTASQPPLGGSSGRDTHHPGRKRPLDRHYRLESVEQEIYFIAAPEVGRFKIGRTGAFDVRFSALQSSSPCRLEPIFVGSGPPALERLCQGVALEFGFMPEHGEWFTGTPTVETCEAIIAAANVIQRENVAAAAAELELQVLERHRRRARERARRKRIDDTKAFFAARRVA